MHELTHNVVGDHNDDFKTLNSQLNREVNEYEAAVKEGTNSLSGIIGEYEPGAGETSSVSSSGLVGGVNVLGGTSSAPLSVGERRRRIVDAAMRRFEEQEAEIEARCATQRSS